MIWCVGWKCRLICLVNYVWAIRCIDKERSLRAQWGTCRMWNSRLPEDFLHIWMTMMAIVDFDFWFQVMKGCTARKWTIYWYTHLSTASIPCPRPAWRWVGQENSTEKLVTVCLHTFESVNVLQSRTVLTPVKGAMETENVSHMPIFTNRPIHELDCCIIVSMICCTKAQMVKQLLCQK